MQKSKSHQTFAGPNDNLKYNLALTKLLQDRMIVSFLVVGGRPLPHSTGGAPVARIPHVPATLLHFYLLSFLSFFIFSISLFIFYQLLAFHTCLRRFSISKSSQFHNEPLNQSLEIKKNFLVSLFKPCFFSQTCFWCLFSSHQRSVT